jgi:hypothetical protein
MEKNKTSKIALKLSKYSKFVKYFKKHTSFSLAGRAVPTIIMAETNVITAIFSTAISFLIQKS